MMMTINHRPFHRSRPHPERGGTPQPNAPRCGERQNSRWELAVLPSQNHPAKFRTTNTSFVSATLISLAWEVRVLFDRAVILLDFFITGTMQTSRTDISIHKNVFDLFLM
jgi:hypothetical protein